MKDNKPFLERYLEALTGFDWVLIVITGIIIALIVGTRWFWSLYCLYSWPILLLLYRLVAVAQRVSKSSQRKPARGGGAMPVPVGIRVTEDTKWNPQAAVGLVNSILERYSVGEDEGDVSQLDITAYPGRIVWGFWSSKTETLEDVASLVRSFYPDAEVGELYFSPAGVWPLIKKSGALFRSNNTAPFDEAYISAHDIRPANDPLIYLTQAMNDLEEPERIVVRFRLFDYQPRPATFEQKLFLLGTQSIAASLSKHPIPRDKRIDEVAQRRKVPTVDIGMSVEMYATSEERLRYLSNVLSMFRNFSADGFGVFDHYYSRQSVLQDVEEDRNRFNYFDTISHLKDEDKDTAAFLLTADELAALWHLPHDQFTAKNIDFIKLNTTDLPDALKDIEGIHIGHSYGKEVRLPVEGRNTHAMIIGRTGTGKTSLMHQMLHEDIAEGRGICVIDPQGRWLPSILQASIPDHRIDDVIILDLAMEVDGVRYPPPLNPLVKHNGRIPTASVLGVLRRIYPDLDETQMETLLELALEALSHHMQPILPDVRRFYRDEGFRAGLLSKVDNLTLHEEWEEIEAEFERVRRQSLQPLVRRLSGFYPDNEARAVTCHPEPVNIRQLVADNKIILVGVGAQQTSLGEAERYVLGSMVVEQVRLAAMSGAITEPPFMLYIDETQNFVHSPIDKLLSQVRQHGLGLVLANQYLTQLTGEAQDAVEGNVGTMFCFEVGATDAKGMRYYMNTFETEELTNLGEYKAAVSMRYQGVRQPAFLLETLSPPGSEGPPDEWDGDTPPPNTPERERYIRKRSVENYTPKTYDEVISWLRGDNANGDTPEPESRHDDQDDFRQAAPD